MRRLFKTGVLRGVRGAAGFAVCLLGLILGRGVFGADLSAAELLKSVKPGHPRLMMDGGTVKGIRGNMVGDAWLRERYRKQKGAADDLLAEPVSKFEEKGGDGILDLSRKVLGRVATLAFVYRMEGDKKYLERCWEELDFAVKLKDWQPRHFLNDAEMTTAVAVGYDWLYDGLSEERRKELREGIVTLGLKPGLVIYQKYYAAWWPSQTDNWNTVCNGGMIIGALAVAEDSPEIAGEVLARGVVSIRKSLGSFAPDGGWPEGAMYWGYATLYEAMSLSSLETSCGTDFGLGDIAGMEQAGWFLTYMNGPAEGAFNFADAEEDTEPRAGAQMLWMARRFHEPRYAEYQAEKLTGRLPVLDVIWGSGLERKPWESIARDKYFRGVEAATMRDSWEDPKGWFMGFKAGSNAVNHSHLDVGTFVLEAKGVRWAVDLGPDDYDLPKYFDETEGRWVYYRLRAEGHNTVVLNPGKGPDQVPSGGGRIVSFVPTEQGVALGSDLSGAYAKGAEVKRDVAYVRGKSVEIRDEVKMKESGDVWWFLQTRAGLKLAEDGRGIVMEEKGQTMHMRLVEPLGARFELGAAEPLETSPHPKGQAVNEGVRRIAVHLKGVREAGIVVRFE